MTMPKYAKVPSSSTMGTLELIETGEFFGYKKIEWSGGNPIYLGKNPDVTASEDVTTWVITKFTWDGEEPTDIQTQRGSWTNRASLSW